MKTATPGTVGLRVMGDLFPSSCKFQIGGNLCLQIASDQEVSKINHNDTPVALIIFRRPEATRRVLEVLRERRVRRLFVIADGPREFSAGDKRLVDQTRELLANLDWECTVTRIYSPVNLGLRQRVLTGLDEVFRHVDEAIILEDDCVPHLDYFEFASTLLERYRNNPEIGLISANNFAPKVHQTNSYHFSTHAKIWGWATWSRVWREFRAAPSPFPIDKVEKERLAELLPGLFRARGFLRLIDEAPKLDSWAIQFAVFCLLSGRLSAVPKVNLALNIGFGKDSTHTKFESFAVEVSPQSLGFPLTHPDEISPDFSEMRRESLIRSVRWLTFPVSHPFDFAGRIFRAAKLLRTTPSISDRA